MRVFQSIVFISILSFHVIDLIAERNSDEESIQKSEIEICLDSVSSFENFDKVYVYPVNSYSLIHFTAGSVGVFDSRDDSYGVVGMCGVFEGRIIFLQKSMEKPLIEESDVFDNLEYSWIYKYDYDKELGLQYCCSKEYDFE